MGHFIAEEEICLLENNSNRATQILRIQSERLQQIRDEGYYDDFRLMEFQQLITSFYADQGKAERIKNFPFPRQYASTALWLTMVFSFFIPFGLLDVYQHLNGWIYWTFPFITGLLIWIFFLMEKIGDYSENPFEGSYNDVPITSIARAIEIDLREMLKDNNIPPPIQPVDGYLL